MRTDRLIDRIVRSSQIPSERRRLEISRELRAHVEDFVLCARGAGHTQEEAERLAFASFGDPRQIALQFGWVYRKQRAALRMAVFLASTITVAVAIAAIVMSLQAGVAIGFGVPLLHAFSARHIIIEAADILATAAAYLGLLSLQKLLAGHSFARAAAALSAIFAVLIALFRFVGAPWRVLLFGLVAALFLRGVQTLWTSEAVRGIVVLAGFVVFGALAFGPVSAVSWLAAGTGYLTMTHLAARVDRALFRQYL